MGVRTHMGGLLHIRKHPEGEAVRLWTGWTWARGDSVKSMSTQASRDLVRLESHLHSLVSFELFSTEKFKTESIIP